MKISLNWLQDFVTLTEPSYDKIKAVITANTAEVETMESQGELLKKVVLGKLEKLEPHPNADKLQLATVYDGKEKIRVVCGGSNLKEGMKIAFAHVGTIVKFGNDYISLKSAKIRGIESAGMICSSPEIDLEEMFPRKQEKDVIDLSAIDTPLGTPINKALGFDDTVIHIDNHAITNRWDLFSQQGFGREFIANKLGKWKKRIEFKIPKINTPPPVEYVLQDAVTGGRYMAVYLTNVTIKESPKWMQQRLSAVGVRPICNIVDITNYVMLEMGTPLHAFDIDQIKGRKWTQRLSKKGEKVVTLDKQEHELMDDVIIFEDGNEIFDLCGIMGGYQSGISEKTNKIWLHCPVYNKTLVRRASRALGHTSEASTIFEKGVDPEATQHGLARAIQLILESCPDTIIASKVVDVWGDKEKIRKIKLRTVQLKRLVGQEITTKEVERILKDLGFVLKKEKGGWLVTVPSHRNDVVIEADLIEEVARIYGYDNIPFTTPIIDGTPVAINARRELEKIIKDQLTAMGFNEIYTFAFLGSELLGKCGMKQNDTTIEISNPISADMSLMRQSLLPRMLETVEQMWRHEEQFRLFELSKTYFKKGDGVEEKTSLIMSTSGENFRTLQGVVEAVGLSVEHVTEPAESTVHHPGRRARITGRGKTVGVMYEVHPQVLKAFDIKSRVVIAEVDMEIIHGMKLDRWSKFKELPRFPSVKLDVSIAIPRRELAAKFFDVIAKTDKTLIEHTDLIDVYEGDKLAADQRGLTFSITYRATDRTLTEEEVNKIHSQVVTNLKVNGAIIR
ncbi:MAG: phenylalanine--tRNA ligase subunit beta [Candidatus Peregrinibacteria bacterium]